MRIFKKFIVILAIVGIVALGMFPNTSNADLSDAQRTAVVKIAAQVVTEGNKNRILRYSWDHRSSGYSWSKVRNHNKQSTQTRIALTASDQQRVLQALKADILKKYPKDEKMQAYASTLNQLKATTYTCRALGSDIYDTIAFDCSTFTSGIYDMALGAGSQLTSSMYPNNSSYSKVSVTSAKPGDILWKNGHVAIYLGDYDNDGTAELAEAGGMSATSASGKAAASKSLADFLIEHPTYIIEHPKYNAKVGLPVVELAEDAIRDSTKQVVIRNVNLNNSGFSAAYTYIGQVRQGRLIDVTGTTTSNNGETVGGKTSSEVENTDLVLGTRTTSVAYWPSNFSTEDQALGNSDGYFHKGTPAYGGYTRIVAPLNWLIESAKDVLDWFVGFITVALKMEVIGWTAIVENLISNGLTFGTEDLTNPTTNGIGTTVVNTIVTTNKTTVEDIIFNNVPLLDINFFSFENAAGQTLNHNSVIFKVREVIAQWYYTLRVVSIILMLIILIYNAIKAMLTTVAADKAEAKKKFVDWLVGFAVVFFIHYFMIGVVSINNNLVNFFKPENITTSQGADSNGSITQSNEESLYEQIRIQAYDMSATTGWTGTFMYMAMVIYLCIFIFMYIKRLFILALLTVISPLVGVLYAFNKKQYGLSTWGKEYFSNVIIQLIHAIIYTVVIAVALSLAKLSTIIGGVIALILMAFIFPLETIMKKIFNYDSKELGGLGESIAGQFAIYHTGRKLTKSLKTATMGTVNAIDYLDQKAVNSKIANTINSAKPVQFVGEYMDKTEAKIRANMSVLGDKLRSKKETGVAGIISGEHKNSGKGQKSFGDYYNQHYKQIKARNYRPTSELEDAINKRKEKEKKAREEFKKGRFQVLTNSIIATAGLSLAVPLMVVNREAGFGALFFGANSYKNAFSRKKIKGIKRPKQEDPYKGMTEMQKLRYKGRKLVFVTVAAPVLTLSKPYSNAIENTIDERQALEKTQRNIQHELGELEKAKLVESNVMDELKKLYVENKDNNEGEKLGKLREQVKTAEKAALVKTLRNSLARFERGDVERVLSNYMDKKGSTRTNLSDVKEIQKMFNKELSDRNINGLTVTDSLSQSIREEVRRKSNMDTGVKKVTKDEKGNEKVEIKARVNVKDVEKICRDMAKEEKIENEIMSDLIRDLRRDRDFLISMQNQDEDKIAEKIKNKLEEKIISADEAEKLSSKFKDKLNKAIDEKTQQEDKSIDKKISKLTSKQLVSLITDAVNSEGVVKVNLASNRYNNLMQEVRRLDDINRDYSKITGEKIYENVGSLVEKIRDKLYTK